ncbi:MAG: polysaccharide biosynthesis C-terminal domain-containing protein [Candidatus Methylomirabilales bacterium]
MSVASETVAPRGPIILRTSIGALASQMAGMACGLVSGILISRGLGPEGRGAYVLPVTVAMVVGNLCHLSLGHANIYLVGDRRWKLGDLLGNASGFSLVLGPMGVVLTILILRGWPGLFSGSPASAAFLVAATVPLTIHQTLVVGLLVLGDRLVLSRLASAGVLALHMVATAVLWWEGCLTVEVVLWLFLAAAVGQWVCATLLARPLGSLRPRVQWDVWRDSLRFGLAIHPGMILLLLHLRVDLFLLQRLQGLEAVGIYSLAAMVAEALWLVPDTTALAATPHQVRAGATEDAAVTLRATRVNVALTAALSLALAAMAPPLVGRVYGRAFLPAVPALWALLPGIVAMAAQRSCGILLVKRDRPWLVSGLLAPAVGINILLNLVLIPYWGAVGAALASSASYVLSSAGFLIWVTRAAGRPFHEGWILNAADARWVFRLLAPRFVRGGKGVKVA